MNPVNPERLPFLVDASSPNAVLPVQQGYVTKVYGAYLSVGPLEAVTGPANLQIGPFAINNGQVQASSSFTMNFIPSTTEVSNFPIYFGDRGLASPVAGEAIQISVSLSFTGSDGGTYQINVWGELVRADVA